MASVYGVAECCDTFSEPKAASAVLVACSVPPPMVITSPLLLRFDPPPRGELPLLLAVCFAADTVFFPVPISWKMQPLSEGAAEAATVTAATPSPAIDLLSAAAVVVTICSMSYSVVVVVAADGEDEVMKIREQMIANHNTETESVSQLVRVRQNTSPARCGVGVLTTRGRRDQRQGKARQ